MASTAIMYPGKHPASVQIWIEFYHKETPDKLTMKAVLQNNWPITFKKCQGLRP
jgi:hypothetical protein